VIAIAWRGRYEENRSFGEPYNPERLRWHRSANILRWELLSGGRLGLQTISGIHRCTH
jgi:hypothetical protein